MHTKLNNTIIKDWKYNWLVSKPHSWNQCDCYELRKLKNPHTLSITTYAHYPAREIIDLVKKHDWKIAKTMGRTVCSICGNNPSDILEI